MSVGNYTVFVLRFQLFPLVKNVASKIKNVEVIIVVLESRNWRPSWVVNCPIKLEGESEKLV